MCQLARTDQTLEKHHNGTEWTPRSWSLLLSTGAPPPWLSFLLTGSPKYSPASACWGYPRTAETPLQATLELTLAPHAAFQQLLCSGALQKTQDATGDARWPRQHKLGGHTARGLHGISSSCPGSGL